MTPPIKSDSSRLALSRDGIGTVGATDADAQPFHVVDTKRCLVALVPKEESRCSLEEDQEAVSVALLKHYPIVVCIDADAPGACVATCYSREADAIDEAAFGIWALKTPADSDESPTMSFHIVHDSSFGGTAASTRIRDAAWVSTTSRRLDPGWEVQLKRPDRLSWEALHSRLARTPESALLVAADVDWAMSYNDVYGHVEGDLMLCRVDAEIRRFAEARGGTFMRTGGDDFMLVFEGPTSLTPTKLAEGVRATVERIGISFVHPEVVTHGIVTVSVAAIPVSTLPARDLDRIRDAVADAVYAAKRSGRNTVRVESSLAG